MPYQLVAGVIPPTSLERLRSYVMRGTAELGSHPSIKGAEAACASEPIHIPGTIQPRGVLVSCTDCDLTISAVSANCSELFAREAAEVIGRPLSLFLPLELTSNIHLRAGASLTAGVVEVVGAVSLPTSAKMWNAFLHRNNAGVLIVEFEREDLERPALDLHNLLGNFVGRLADISTATGLCQAIAEEIHDLSLFDRVLVYRFDEGWNGTVVAEARNENLPSYLDLRFPASDIPAQARALYRSNSSRLISDVSYTPVPIVGINDLAALRLDLSYCTLRSVSPVHLQYMRNMGTGASMSFSVMKQGALWGLVSCHHREPKAPSFEVRRVGELMTRAFALQIAAREQMDEFAKRAELRGAYARLLALMANTGDFIDGLMKSPDELLHFLDASGAAVVRNGTLHVVGAVPDERAINRLVRFLFENIKEEIFVTEEISRHLPEEHLRSHYAAGVLAIAISKIHPSYVIWFRPEVVRTVQWGGDPRKPLGDGDENRLNPRTSFEAWKETVHNRSLPWDRSQVEAAQELRNAIVGIVLRNAEEMADLSVELERTNKELESFSYSVSHDLRAPLRHIVGFAELLRESAAGELSSEQERYIDTIIGSTEQAGKLVDSLLAFSRLGKSALVRAPVSLATIVADARELFATEESGRAVTWVIGDLPTVDADPVLMRVVFENLLSNALKYTRSRDAARIEVGSTTEGGEVVLFVRDNGIGFDMRYVDKLFGVFQRLHRMEDFEGTGIGLANVRRAIERHGGRVWAKGEVNQGATFFVALPMDSQHVEED